MTSLPSDPITTQRGPAQDPPALTDAAEWFAAHGRDGDRAIIPTIKAKFPELTAVQAIEVAKRAAEIVSERT